MTRSGSDQHNDRVVIVGVFGDSTVIITGTEQHYPQPTLTHPTVNTVRQTGRLGRLVCEHDTVMSLNDNPIPVGDKVARKAFHYSTTSIGSDTSHTHVQDSPFTFTHTSPTPGRPYSFDPRNGL